jgi:hypothetical protein
VFAPTILFIAGVLLGARSWFFWSLIVVLGIARLSLRRHVVVQESLLVMRGVGVQLGTLYSNGRREQQLIQQAHIKNVIINEGIKSYKVMFYMAFLVEGVDHMLIAFPV